MKKFTLAFFIALFCFTQINFSQVKLQTNLTDKSTVSADKGTYPIDARPFIWWGEELSRKSRAENPDFFEQAKLRKTSAWNFIVGDTHTWWGQTMDGNANWHPIASTCRAVGTNCYVFVEDAMWTNGRMNQTGVEAVVNNFDSSTPANASKGIYQTLNEVYGNPPNVDADNKIIILVHDIIDGYTGTGGYVAGYFWSYHEIVDDPQYDHSNEAEMLFIDCDPAVLTNPTSVTNAMDVVAHEFQHMINWNYNPQQATFFDEGCSLVAEPLCGYPFREQTSYSNETNHYLLDWRGDDNVAVLTDYSRAARFMLYMYEQFGVDFMTKFVQAPSTSINGIDWALANLITPTARRFNNADLSNNILIDWYVANILDDKTVNTRWGYNLQNLTKAVPRSHPTPNVTMTDAIQYYGAQYISFTSGSNLNIRFDATSPNFVVKAVKIGTNKVVEDVTRNTDYSIPDFGTTYPTVHFIAISRSQMSVLNYTYTSTGTGGSNNVELAYDDTEPTGVLTLSTGDTICVEFTGVPGTKLRRITVALRQAGTMAGRIYKNTGDFESLATVNTPLGQPLSPEFNIANRPDRPYPVPWPNWITVDLTQYDIDTEEDFAVGVVLPGTYPETNRVMVTQSAAHTSYYHSSNYVSDPGPGNGDPRWLYYVSTGDSWTYLYMIRATVTFDITGVEDEIELVPKGFVLDQNYPNPFNPTTNIRYQLPEYSDVSVKVYDIMGREVATLVNEARPAGNYEVNWNGENYYGQKVSSGIYFYTIKANNYLQTRKMVLMK